MHAHMPLEDLRRRYAAEVVAATGTANARVEAAFAAVPREAFLTPAPWHVFFPGGVTETITSDPAVLYQDVLVVLDVRQGINNGQPSLHAAWMSALDPQPGETAIHIGTGTGYYTAILATLVGANGRVHAYEIEPALAELSARHLAILPQVIVHAASGVGASLPDADLIDVNAAATAPDPSWLRALKANGRLIFPWQATREGAVTLIVRRRPGGFSADPTFGVGFIPCVGAQAEASASPSDRDVIETRSIWLNSERSPDDTATAVYDEVWFSSRPIELAGKCF